jgi:hypothetical protein
MKTLSRRRLGVLALLLIALLLMLARPIAEQAAPLSALAQMPIREVTIFKDGHAFVWHEGTMPTDGAGHVLMDYLPTPVLGTFWAQSADPKVRLTSAFRRPSPTRVPPARR